MIPALALGPKASNASSFIADDTDGPAVDTEDSAASSSPSSSYAAWRAIRRAGAADAAAWRGENPGAALVAPNLSGACGPELGRWVTPYRRSIGRWLTEVSCANTVLHVFGYLNTSTCAVGTYEELKCPMGTHLLSVCVMSTA